VKLKVEDVLHGQSNRAGTLEELKAYCIDRYGNVATFMRLGLTGEVES